MFSHLRDEKTSEIQESNNFYQNFFFLQMTLSTGMVSFSFSFFVLTTIFKSIIIGGFLEIHAPYFCCYKLFFRNSQKQRSMQNIESTLKEKVKIMNLKMFPDVFKSNSLKHILNLNRLLLQFDNVSNLRMSKLQNSNDLIQMSVLTLK